jgi:hygromycin-B 7''-O-kinase
MLTADLLKIQRAEYEQRFRDPEFGLELAHAILPRHALPTEIRRKTEGSSLVFELGPELFLKIVPPFFADSFSAELTATALATGRLRVKTPEIVLHGKLESWDYLVSRRVPGKQASSIFGSLKEDDLRSIAEDLGSLLRELHAIEAPAFERDYGPWETFLRDRLQNQRAHHLARGNFEEWVERICAFVAAQTPRMLELAPPVFLHADLSQAHVMLDQVNGHWRIVGLLDFADAMKGPREIDFILPFLDFFRGRSSLQKQLLEAYGYGAIADRESFSELLLALTLQNRFMAFHDWFKTELESGATSLPALARKVYPL